MKEMLQSTIRSSWSQIYTGKSSDLSRSWQTLKKSSWWKSGNHIINSKKLLVLISEEPPKILDSELNGAGEA